MLAVSPPATLSTQDVAKWVMVPLEKITSIRQEADVKTYKHCAEQTSECTMLIGSKCKDYI
jgi:hypothetical protein